MKKIFVLALVAGYFNAIAQNDIDALRYSKSIFGGTARSAGIAGAVGSLGADVSSTAINPAGIAFFKKEELSFTLGFINFSNKSNYLGNISKETDFNMNFPNFGLILCSTNNRKDKPKEWVSSTFSLSFLKSGDFNNITRYSGINTQSSLMDYFAERANGYTINDIRASDDDFDNGFSSKTSMAWEGYLIDSVAPKKYAAHASPIFHNISQNGIVKQSGKMNDLEMTFSGNYKNQLYLGASFSYSFINFTESKSHSEKNDPNDTSNYAMNNFTFDENLETTGGALSCKLGLITKLNENFRLGISFQTPKFFNLTDNYSFRLNSVLRNGEYYKFDSKLGEFNYNIITPYRITISGTAISGKIGFISADLDFVDYSTMKLKSENFESNYDQAMQIANDEIVNKYKNTINYRIGGELILSSYRIRGGYAMYGSPFSDKNLKNHGTNYYTAGVGIKEKDWGLDFGLIIGKSKETYQPYILNDKSKDPTYVSSDINTQRVVLTYVYKF